MMRRKETLLVMLTVLAVGAGVVAGMVVSRLPAVATGAPNGGAAFPASPGQSALAQELHLSTQQTEQMRQTWESVREKVRLSYESADRLNRQRDEAIQAMLTPEQKAKFEKLTQDFADRFIALRKDRDSAFSKAVEETRKILSDEQRKKYDELLKTMAPAVQ